MIKKNKYIPDYSKFNKQGYPQAKSRVFYKVFFIQSLSLRRRKKIKTLKNHQKTICAFLPMPQLKMFIEQPFDAQILAWSLSEIIHQRPAFTAPLLKTQRLRSQTC